MPAITSGRASVWPRSRAERSIRAASVAGSASWTRCTSSHPGARLVSMSSSAAMRRCSALRRSIAAPSAVGAGAGVPPDDLFEDTIALECAPFVWRQAQDLSEDVIVVRADGRAWTVLAARRRRQPERRGHHVHVADGRVLHDRPHPAMRELRVTEQLGYRKHRRDPEPSRTQKAHDLVAIVRRGPRADSLIELRASTAAFRRRRRSVDARDLTQSVPLFVAPHAERDPAVRADAAIHAVRRGDRVGVAAATRYSSVRGELEDRGREELQSRLVLREVDRASGAGALSSLERGEHGDRAVTDRDVVDVRPVEKDGGRVGLAEQLNESGERAQLAAVTRVERMWSGLPLVAAREDDQPGVIVAQRLRAKAEPRDGAGGEALDEHVGRADERPREGHTLRVFQVERRAALAIVVEGEHRRAIGRDDAVLEWRVGRAEHVGGEPALEADDLSAEVREVLADEGPRGSEPHLDNPHAAQRAAAGGRDRSCRELGHTTPPARSRASSSEPTPASA